jgi:small-conductance mechanosensitive channel
VTIETARKCVLSVLLFLLPATPLRAAWIQVLETKPSNPPASSDTAREVEIPPPPSAKQVDQSIPLSLIADRAEELDNLLFEVSRQLSSIQEMLSTGERTGTQDNEIRERLLFVDSLVAGVPTAPELRDENYYWMTLSRQYAAYRKTLTSRGVYLENQTHLLDEQQTVWQATLDQIHETNGIMGVVARINQELTRIRSTQQQVKDQLILVLAVQNVTSRQDRQISEALSKLGKAQDQLRSHVFERDGSPLWRIGEWRWLERPLATSILEAARREFEDATAFLRANRLFIVVIFLVYVLALLAAFKLKRYVSTRTSMEIPPEALVVFSHPFSFALLLALLGTIGRLHEVTTGIACLIVWLWLLQASRLLPPLIEPKTRSVFRLMVPFSIFETARMLIPFSAILKRELFVFNVLAALVALTWLTRKWGARALLTLGRVPWLFEVAVRMVLLFMAASLVSNIFGFRSLSQALGISAFLGFLAGAALYGGMRVLDLLLVTLLRGNWARSVLETHARTVEQWGSRGLILAAVLVWLRGMLQLFTVYDPFIGSVSRVLERQLGYGNVHFSLGGVLSVLLTMVIGYALANFFTLVLKQFVLPKLRLHRGVPYAISKVTYYGLLLLVTMTALTEAGVELSKFTVLTGALGVGLGFGMQNIVNNFVSGLILLFERPVHVGDTVDIGGLIGRVRRIGARSSTVLTFQGAEVIVPNSNLISNQVINWTLSSAWRRVDILVNVAYGTDPERVLKLLVEAADSHPGVLRERPSTAYFLGFGENALNFELRFWSAHQETWFDLQSEVTLAVAKSLHEAGIEIPFPQRDLHLRSMTASVEERLADHGFRVSPTVASSEPDRSSAAPHK